MGEIITIGSPEWLAARRMRITATDVAAILQVTPEEGRYRDSTPLKIARRIKIARGLMQGELEADQDESDLLFAGTASEDLNAKLYERIAGRESRERGDGVRTVLRDFADFMRHPKHDWLASTTDGLVLKYEREEKLGPRDVVGIREAGVWEAKMPIYGRAKWREGVPLAYKLQTTVSMAIRGRTWGSISGLRLPTVDWTDIEFNEATWLKILAYLQAWWGRYCMQDQMPDAEAGDSGLLRDLHRPEPKKTIFLPQALSDTAHDLAAAMATRDALNEEIEHAKAKLQQHMHAEQAEIAMSADGEIGWKFTKQVQQVKAKPATEAGTREVVKFERFKQKG